MRNEPAVESTRLGPRLVASVLGHAFVVLLLFFWPTSAPPALPASVTVDLLAALPAAPPPAAAPKPKPAPAPKAVPKPPPPPPPKPKQVVLPKKAPDVTPRPKAKPAPKPVKRPARIERPRREKVDELEYDDALDLLRKELGEERPPNEESTDQPPAETPSAGAVRVSPEMARWLSDARRHVRAKWITPQEFIDRGLSTELSVELTADGRVVGTPKVTRPSGDPFWDDNTVRAVLAASPLPPPPSPGKRTFVFTPEERF